MDSRESVKLQPAVSFFPSPLPDELLDSVIYRYHRLSGNAHPRNTIRTFYGSTANSVPKLLTNGIDLLHARLPTSLFATPDDLIQELTMVPAFGAVLDQRQMNSVRSASLSRGLLGHNVHYRSATRVMHSSLHCCPMCVREETEQIGVAYWHRSHQLDGVKVCHDHGCDLISACPYCHEPISPSGSMNLPGLQCAACHKPLLAVFSYQRPVREIARLGHEALSGVLPFCDRRWLGYEVRRLIGSDTQDVCDEIREVFSADYLDDDTADPFYTFTGDWLEHAFRVRQTIRGAERDFLNLPSLMHMMVLVHFLFGDWEEVAAPAAQRKQAA